MFLSAPWNVPWWNIPEIRNQEVNSLWATVGAIVEALRAIERKLPGIGGGDGQAIYENRLAVVCRVDAA